MTWYVESKDPFSGLWKISRNITIAGTCSAIFGQKNYDPKAKYDFKPMSRSLWHPNDSNSHGKIGPPIYFLSKTQLIC